MRILLLILLFTIPAQALDYARLLYALSYAETANNPWIRTKHVPKGGSTAYGPLQLTQATINDYWQNNRYVFNGLPGFYQKSYKQAKLFRTYGNNPTHPGYKPAFDYGGEGLYATDRRYQEQYWILAQRILIHKIRYSPTPIDTYSAPSEQTKLQIMLLWRGDYPDAGYVSRFNHAYASYR